MHPNLLNVLHVINQNGIPEQSAGYFQNVDSVG